MHAEPSTHVDPREVPSANVAQAFDAALKQLASVKPFARARYQPAVVSAASDLLDSEAGVRALYERADTFESDGVFHNSQWADGHALQPSLVGNCLLSGGGASTMEALSELRLLAAANGRNACARLTPDSARRFLRETVALHLDLLFPASSGHRSRTVERARRVFALIAEEMSLDGLRAEVTEEVLDLVAQRPIITRRVRKLISLAVKLPAAAQGRSGPDALEPFQRSLDGPSRLSQIHPTAAGYRSALLDASMESLELETTEFGTSLRHTGIVHAHHPVLLRCLSRRAPDLVARALALETNGRAEFERHRAFVLQLINATLVPGTKDAVLGLAGVLERGYLSNLEVAQGLRALIELDILPDVERHLLASHGGDPARTPNAVLAAGALSVLGQPLGLGQGENATCQAARGISLWATSSPGLLLQMLASAASKGSLQIAFGDETIESNPRGGPGLEAPDLQLDPVQIVLVPHLNRVYEEMLARSGGRSADPHKWVNPAMYGRSVPKGFATCIDAKTQTITRYEDFVRMFFATHHPSFMAASSPPCPNPVGLLVTDVAGRYLGPHAVTIERVAPDPSGLVRVYFFNPNNDGRQRWALDITPTVRGFGELPGESSLPFVQFASRLYAFHYDPYHQGESYAVPSELVRTVGELASASWGSSFAWNEPLVTPPKERDAAHDHERPTETKN